LSFTDHAEGGPRPLPGTEEGSGGGTVVPAGTFVPAPDEVTVVPSPPAVLETEPEPTPGGPVIVSSPVPGGLCCVAFTPPSEDDEAPGSTVGVCGAPPVVTSVEPIPSSPLLVVVVVTVTVGDDGVVTSTDGDVGTVVEVGPVISGEEAGAPGVTVLDSCGPVSLEISSSDEDEGGVTESDEAGGSTVSDDVVVVVGVVAVVEGVVVLGSSRADSSDRVGVPPAGTNLP
jgi:hypothetical protein